MLNKCQVFTPVEQVNIMLDTLGYTENLFGKTILENACGEGAILKQIVGRYISDSKNNGLSDNEIIYGLENDIMAFDIDPVCVRRTKKNLDIVAKEFGLKKIEWQIICADSLFYNFNTKFSFIISNPPYVTYHDITPKIRKKVRENFETCKLGRFDYSYAFIEKSIELLNFEGELVYLIPINVFKTSFGQNLRDLMKESIESIFHYVDTSVFKSKSDDEILTSPAIVKLKKNSSTEVLQYENDLGEYVIVNKNELNGKWIFKENWHFPAHHLRFGDFFQVSNSIATLRNDAFIIRDFVEQNGLIVFEGNNKVEVESTKISTSPRTIERNRNERIIFPYYFEKDSLERYTEEIYRENFPLAYGYLQNNRISLDKRKSDKVAKWFEYGRSQALRNMWRHKLMISTVVTNEVRIYELDENIVPYSGLYIISISELPLTIARDILLSDAFYQYVTEIGINIKGGSLRITSNDINDFKFDGGIYI